MRERQMELLNLLHAAVVGCGRLVPGAVLESRVQALAAAPHRHRGRCGSGPTHLPRAAGSAAMRADDGLGRRQRALDERRVPPVPQMQPDQAIRLLLALLHLHVPQQCFAAGVGLHPRRGRRARPAERPENGVLQPGAPALPKGRRGDADRHWPICAAAVRARGVQAAPQESRRGWLGAHPPLVGARRLAHAVLLGRLV